jgi:DNA-binding MarR family transcriptional regulator
VIDRLAAAGFVKRSQDPKDRRKVIVTFLPEKHATNAKIHYTALAGAVKDLFATYTEDQLNFLIRHTQALTAIYQEQTRLIDAIS